MRLLFMIFMFGTTLSTCNVVVQTNKGKVRGTVMTTFTNKTFYAFRGIPYAKPPVGELRFQPPQSPDAWKGVFDDRGANKMCIQDAPTLSEDESEDCLYLHVYSPKLPTIADNTSFPVMYVIHGGGFVMGSAGLFKMGPHYLMDYNVIVVTVAYRLGFFGFLSTNDLNCPGNYGFKDQLLGLKWVKENIHSFGGDPKRMTIFGESAGAACVGYHLMSPKSKGLFRGAIQNSGSILASWNLQRKPRNIAYQFASTINSSISNANTTTQELMQFFRTLNVQEVKTAVNKLFGSGTENVFPQLLRGFMFGGVIEPKHDDAFMTELMYGNLMAGKFNKVPTLMGMNSGESLFLLADKHLKESLKQLDEHPEMYVSVDMNITDLELLKSIGKDIRKIYVNNSNLHDNLGLSLRYFSDAAFVRPGMKQAKLQSLYSDVYLYEFDYRSNLSKSPIVADAGRVVHTEDMMYLFHKKKFPNPFTKPQADITTMKRMLTMWTNFVKYLNPTPEPLELLQNITWPKVSSKPEFPYLYINENLEVRNNLKKHVVDAYERLYNTFAIPPLDDY